jgi:acyl phosphate:glycerol-3-phosphate acyltransferase
VLLATRFVSLASLAAVTILLAAWLLASPAPLASDLPITLYLFAGALTVLAKHRANIRRLRAGAENQIGDFPMRETLLRVLHVLALGLWFGGATFFNFVAAPLIFQTFDSVVKSGPSDRTAHYDITQGMSVEDQQQLGKALAGAAVGPVFPPYYLMQTVCCAVALATALAWWKRPEAVHRRRVLLLTATLLLVVLSVAISEHVSNLRVLRFNTDKSVSDRAKALFAGWHLASLLLSMVTTTLAGIALAMAAKLPERTAA